MSSTMETKINLDGGEAYDCTIEFNGPTCVPARTGRDPDSCSDDESMPAEILAVLVMLDGSDVRTNVLGRLDKSQVWTLEREAEAFVIDRARDQDLGRW